MYDMAALMIPAAFLARDQLEHGWTRAEPVVAFGLFGAALLILLIFRDAPGGTTFGSTPTGTVAALLLSGMILRLINRAGRPGITAAVLQRTA